MSGKRILNPSDPSSKIILGVDDVPENLFLLKAAVKSAGYTFLGASSGIECMRLLLRVMPRVILLDIEMPETDGFETCRRIKANPALRHIPVIFLTARKGTGDVAECRRVGGNGFIVKPFDAPELQDRLRHWSGRRIAAERPYNCACG
jgi:CheY-like chemotaxis protein